jgi:predicted RNA methylase
VLPRHRSGDSRVTKFLQALAVSDYQSLASRKSLLYSVGVKLLPQTLGPAGREFLAAHKTDCLDIPAVPLGSFDLLGTIYQYVSSKAENLEKGSFYTSPSVADEFVADLKFGAGEVLFDPSCGSGIFLIRAKAGPSQIVGVDNDPVAIMIANFNYFLKFPEGPSPRLYVADYFDWSQENSNAKFEYIVANPPFGASVPVSAIVMSAIRSGESFSHFIESSTQHLSDDGIARFLVPDSLLNVKRHSDIRDFLLKSVNLKRVRHYTQRFAGLMSDFHLIEFSHGKTQTVHFERDSAVPLTSTMIQTFQNSVFLYLSKLDIELLALAADKGKWNLSVCQFGLGVVTGNNTNMLSEKQLTGMEPIYTGKQVTPYALSEPNRFILFDRSKLQQVAREEIYRAPLKLVYKVIAKRLIVAIDYSGALTSNSANIIVPPPNGPSGEAIAAVLNSSMASFLHQKLFGDVKKIGKENLLALPLPTISPEHDSSLVQMVSRSLSESVIEELDEYVSLNMYGLTAAQHSIVRSLV